jgi:lysophospholipase L1-like esterase
MNIFFQLLMMVAFIVIPIFQCSANSSTGVNNEPPDSSSSLASSYEQDSLDSGASSYTETSSSSYVTADTSNYQWVSIPAPNDNIRIYGRSYTNSSGFPTIDWSGSYFEFAFEGTQVDAVLKGDYNYIHVFLDNDTIPIKTLDLETNFDTIFTLVSDLQPGKHTLKLYKRTEAQVGPFSLKNLNVFGTGLVPLPAPPQRKLLFIGNSITCGYGNLDSLKENPWSNQSEDHYYTYAAISARLANAGHHSICYSGRGVFRNNTNSEQGVLPDLLSTVSPTHSSPYDSSQYIPDAVIINLGTNDFYKGIPDSASFVNATIRLVQKMDNWYSDKPIFLIDGPMLSDYYPNVPEDSIANFPSDSTGYPSAYFRKSGSKYTYKSLTVAQRFLDAAYNILLNQGIPVIRYSFKAQDASLGYGADWHPSIKRHHVMGELLYSEFKKELGW